MTRKRVARMAGIPSNRDHRLHLVQFTRSKTRGPGEKTRGIFGNSGLLDVPFRYWRYDRCENEKSSNTAKYGAYKGLRW
jgi:hypothetical protein